MDETTPPETPPTPPVTPAAEDPGPIPYTRFAEVNARLKASEEAAKVAAARAEAAEKRAQELEGAVESERIGAAIALAGVRHPKAAETLRGLYTSTPDRPPFADWYAAFVKENPWFNPGGAPVAPSLNGGAVERRARQPSAAEIAKMTKDEFSAYMKETGGKVSLR